MNISETIKNRRKYLDITQIDLAEISGVSLATIKDLERGKGNPSLSTLEKVADTLGLEVSLKLKEIKL